jgi:hypothetical protein
MVLSAAHCAQRCTYIYILAAQKQKQLNLIPLLTFLLTLAMENLKLSAIFLKMSWVFTSITSKSDFKALETSDKFRDVPSYMKNSGNSRRIPAEDHEF